jgi:hypothetical protein
MSAPRLILPHGTERREPINDVRAAVENRPRFNLPQEMKDEVRKHVPEAKEIAEKINGLLEKGNAAQVALICQEPVRNFVGNHIRALLPQMVQTFAQSDRTQILHFFQQISRQRLDPKNLAQEKIDKATYELAISDFVNLISRVPAQVFPIEIGLPDLDLEPTQEAPQDTQQGAS